MTRSLKTEDHPLYEAFVHGHCTSISMFFVSSRGITKCNMEINFTMAVYHGNDIYGVKQ